MPDNMQNEEKHERNLKTTNNIFAPLEETPILVFELGNIFNDIVVLIRPILCKLGIPRWFGYIFQFRWRYNGFCVIS